MDEHKPNYPIMMMIFAFIVATADAIFSIIGLIPFVGPVIGGGGSAAVNAGFYITFTVAKLMHHNRVLSLGNYTARAVLGDLLNFIPGLNVLENVATVHLTYRAEVKKWRASQEGQEAGTDTYPEYAAANDNYAYGYASANDNFEQDEEEESRRAA